MAGQAGLTSGETPRKRQDHAAARGRSPSADALHNFLGGLAVGAAFTVDVRVGVVTWLVAAAHEVPQELGDFGILVHSGWKARAALAYNVTSALTFLIGGSSPTPSPARSRWRCGCLSRPATSSTSPPPTSFRRSPRRWRA
jgi:hypothetical protein